MEFLNDGIFALGAWGFRERFTRCQNAGTFSLDRVSLGIFAFLSG